MKFFSLPFLGFSSVSAHSFFLDPKKESFKDVAAPAKTNAKKVDKEAKLATMLEGLKHVVVNQAALGGSNSADTLLSPFIASVSTILEGVKKKEAQKGGISAAEKAKKMDDADKQMKALMLGIEHRAEDLVKEQTNSATNLLLGVLLNKQKEKIAVGEQYEVLDDSEWVDLDVVKYVKLHKGKDSRDLVIQVSEYLDNPKKLSKEEEAAAKKQEKVDQVVKMLQNRIMALAKNLKDGKDGGKMSHVEIASVAANIKTLQGALKAVKAGDMAALERAQKTLRERVESLKKMMTAARNVFLQADAKFGVDSEADNTSNTSNTSKLGLLQMWSRKDCPYCKAECFEKCHDGGKPYVACLQECSETEAKNRSNLESGEGKKEEGKKEGRKAEGEKKK